MAGPVPLVTHLLVASRSWESAQQMSGVRGASSDSQARDQFHGSFHITFPGKNLAGTGSSTTPRVSLQGRAQQQQLVHLPSTAAGMGVLYSVTSAGGNMDLGMHDLFKRKRR